MSSVLPLFTEEQLTKIANRKCYTKKSCKSDNSQDESEILGEESKISGSGEESALQYYTSPPHPSNIAKTGTPGSGMEPLSPHSPKKQKPVPPIPGTALQNKIEKSLGPQMSLQLKQEIAIFQASILEAFNKLSDQQRSLQEQINKPRASATVSKLPSHCVDQLDPDPLPGTIQISDSNQRPSDPRDTSVVYQIYFFLFRAIRFTP